MQDPFAWKLLCENHENYREIPDLGCFVISLSNTKQGDDAFGSICPSGFVGAMLCTTLWVQDYFVHHQPALCTMMHKGDLCPREVDIEHTQVVHKHTHV